ncbi:neuroparsin-A-like [Zootermopsis nevadensis]|uniref:Neuroparsin-A n=1 Tax=Zootermopsis nevadensis TaxID=136037 RepID=A0A067R607_ZOONE|nr:neuroparsin-A-like [Zootermopsis nevadensis]XP_021923106.1 neuroparsin-A-like [Zootermopsis nevadensis]KDR17790.1 Neuroparsin-A [Zootermopsis nevadensis]
MKSCAVCILASAFIFLLLQSCKAGSLICKPCMGNDCNLEPESCEHGIERDYCGWKVCAKGPGDYCGGPSDVRGKCGEGMHCACGKCNGCSLTTLDCYFGLDQLQCL